jgi:hypothetical protein
MGQVNIAYDDLQVANLDRVAAARRMARPDFLRAIATEAIEAHDAGRLAFQRDDSPRLDVSINALAIRLNETIMELERSQRANQAHEKKMLGAWTGTEENVRAAEERLLARINDINRRSYQPFLTKLDRLREPMEDAEERVLAAIKQELDGITERLDLIADAAAEPSVEHNIVLGDDRILSASFLAWAALPVGLLFILLFLLLVGQVQPFAVPVANRLLTDTEHVCRLVNRRYGVENCEVPANERVRAVKVIEADK